MFGFLGSIFGAAGGTAAKGVLEGVGGLATSIRSAITGEISPEKKAELEKLLIEFEGKAKQGQMDINIAEAQHKSIFVAGWRPYIGWVCGTGLAYSFVFAPIMQWILLLVSAKMSIVIPTLPIIDVGTLMTLVMAMLGLSGMRSYEKKNNVNQKH